jgi:predicted nucleic acid-binding protein
LIYLDASALVTLTVERENWKELRRFLGSYAGVPTATSTVGLVETVRICDQIGSFPNLMASLGAEHSEVSVDGFIRDAAAGLAGNVRSLDAIHIASAEAYGSALTALVTYDNRMAELARGAGLPVAMPGAE